MDHAYAERGNRETSSSHDSKRQTGGGEGSALDALRSLAAQSSAAPPGTPVDLPGAVRAKFEASFGTDLSALRLYRSQAVADAGAKAVAQGPRVTFAPGVLDFTSRKGQELLGHEISHVVSQQRGGVTGDGFLYDAGLEARADREGAMAAAGERVAVAPPTMALSSASAAPAAGPMQAALNDKTKEKLEKAQAQEAPAEAPAQAPAPEANLNDFTAEAAGNAAEVMTNVSEQYTNAGMAAMGQGDMEGALGAMKTGTQIGTANAALGLGSGVLGLGTVLQMQEMMGDKGSKATSANLKMGSAAAGLGVGAAGLGLGAQISMGKALNATEQMDMEGSEKHMGTAGTLGKVAGGLGLGAQLLELGTNINSLRDATQIKNRMSANAQELQQQKDKGGELSADQEMMRKIYKQSAGQAKVNQISGSFDIAKNTLGMGSTIANLSGAVGVGKGFDLASKAVGKIGGAVTDYEKAKFHDATVEEELETGKNTDAYAEDEDTAAEWADIGEEERKAAFLRHKGYKSGTAEEAFNGITQQRAGFLLGGGASEEQRNKFLDDANIVRDEDPSKPSEATQMSVFMNLGGDLDAKFADKFSDENDDFLGAANMVDEKDGKFVSNAKAIGRDVAGLGRGLWGSIKSAGGKLAALGRGVWRGMKAAGRGIKKGAVAVGKGIKKGAVTAGRGIKDFVTNKRMRKIMLQSAKSGLGKLGSGIANGVYKAGAGIARGAVGAAKGIGKAAKAVGGGIKTLFTDPRRAWQSMKLGARKMGRGIKSGLGKMGSGIAKAGRYVGGVLKHQGGKIKNWYDHGMEQLVMNKGHYDKMTGWDRFKWTMGNLPARIAYNFKGARDKTANRLANTLKAEALMRYTDSKKQKKAS